MKPNGGSIKFQNKFNECLTFQKMRFLYFRGINGKIINLNGMSKTIYKIDARADSARHLFYNCRYIY